MPKTMSLRLPDEQAANLEAIAQVDGVSVAAEIRDALAERIAARRADKEFQKRLRASMERNRQALERLAQ